MRVFKVELDIEGIFTRQAKDFALDFLLLQESDGTLMPVYHCHKPVVFRPKMAIFQRAGMREGELPLPLTFQYLIFMI